MLAVANDWLHFWTPLLLTHGCLAQSGSIPQPSTHQFQREIHVPIVSARRSPSLERRGKMGSAGLGDYLDVSYNVLIEIGGISVPVLIDTGSSDLWVLGDSCTTGCNIAGNVPLYPHSSVNSTGLDVALLYGDSGTGTYAYGVIGNGDVGLAEISASGQQFAFINKTNAGLTESGSSGILGLGFPVNSVLWNTIFVKRYLHSPNLLSHETSTGRIIARRKLKNQQYLPFQGLRFRQSHFPDLSFLSPGAAQADYQNLVRTTTRSLSDSVFWSYSNIGPFLGRLVATKSIDPMFAITLQRDTVEIGGNVGQLSIGCLPTGVQNDSLTWVPVRGYKRDQGGLPAPSDSPYEVYPIAWEIPIDNVFLDGVVLPRSNLSSPTISLSALIDTGNSLIRGPEDVVQEIERRIGASFPCSEAHTLAFSIGGKLFQVDPRDFVFQEFTDSVAQCIHNVVSTDPPAVGGYLFSWSLGVPFLKGVLSAYYFGDLQYPSRDPPRIGLTSTVPEDAAQRLKAAVDAAKASGGNLPFSSEPAPTGPRVSVTPNEKGSEPPRSNDQPVSQGHAFRISRNMRCVVFPLIAQVLFLGMILWI